MRKLIKNLTAFVIVCTIFTSIILFAVSATEVNSHTVNVGDTITLEIHAVGCERNVQGVDVSFYYDSTALEYVEGSLDLSNLSGTLVNTDLAGEIRFNAIDIEGFSFYEDKILASAQFRLVSDYVASPNLSYEIKSFIDDDMVDHEAEYIYDVTYINGEVQETSADESAVTDSDTNFEDTDTQTDNSDILGTDTDNTAETDSANESALSEIESAFESDSEDESIAESEADFSEPELVEEDISQNSSEEINSSQVTETKKNYTTGFIIATGVIVLLAIVFVIVIKSTIKGKYMS